MVPARDVHLIHIIPILSAMSATCGDLVMNMLSVTFILDGDHILYDCFVSEQCYACQASLLRLRLIEA